MRQNEKLIMVVEDDPDDRLMIQEAIQDVQIKAQIKFAENGVELLNYLNQCSSHTKGEEGPVPDLILLDLNMPKMSGLEVLDKIKASPSFRSIPVVVLTTSKDDLDIVSTYEKGGNSFISKPLTFAELVDVVKDFERYWLACVQLPNKRMMNER